MNRVSSTIGWGAYAVVMLAALVTAGAAVAADAPFHFHRYSVPLDMVPEGPVFPVELPEAGGGSTQGFLVHGVREGVHVVKAFRLVGGETGSARPIAHLDLPHDLLGFDVDPGAPGRPGRLLLLDAEGLSVWRMKGPPRRLLTSGSLYRGGTNPELRHLELLRDLDGDGVLDLLLPDFDGWIWRRAEGDGFGEAVHLPLPLPMTTEGSFVTYRRMELATVSGSAYALLGGETYTMPVDGVDGPAVGASGLEGDPSYWGRGILIADVEADQRDLTETGIYLFAEMTGDRVPDALVQVTRSAGVFDKSSSFALHPGRLVDGVLRFTATPTGSVSSDGIHFDADARDIDGDGRSDLMAPSVRFSVGRVIAALVSGGFRYDLDFHRQLDGGRFSEKPDFSLELSIEFDLGSGHVTAPVVGLPDLDGDGLLDLVVGEGEDTLHLHHGIGGDTLFDAEPESIEVPLPGVGDLAQIVDLDRDGRDDVVIRYGNGDPSARQTVLEVLLSREP